MIITDTGSYSDIVFGCCIYWVSSTGRSWRTCPISGCRASPTMGGSSKPAYPTAGRREIYRREGKRQSNLIADIAIWHAPSPTEEARDVPGLLQRDAGLSALGLVLNCVVLWNTVYLDQGLSSLLRGRGYPMLDTDVTRLVGVHPRPTGVERAVQLRAARPGGAAPATMRSGLPDDR
ncbi:Tn3 family transposase [Streptomyces gardneri]|nr:Tn3 family transposase [Streptomyces gardneri]UAK33645.1 transposase [Nocardia asteroides]